MDSVATIRVLLPIAHPLGVLDYSLPPPHADGSMSPMPSAGDFVQVPFGTKIVIGVVWPKPESATNAVPYATKNPPLDSAKPIKLKSILAILPTAPLPLPLCLLIEWVAAYVMAPPGAILKMALNIEAVTKLPRAETRYKRALSMPKLKNTEVRQRVLDQLPYGTVLSESELVSRANVAKPLIHTMEKKGIIEKIIDLPAKKLPNPQQSNQRMVSLEGWSLDHLSMDQLAIAKKLITAVQAAKFSTSLLQGVTGSGKTEVYFAAIAEALRIGKQTLVLLPEIALSAQWLERFHKRFGFVPLQWHSQLSPKQKREVWSALHNDHSHSGTAEVIIGARSALFLPLRRLGLIVVDEEHDASFKQDEGVHYHARDMAIVRAQIESVPIILASATPSLESLENATRGKYQIHQLPDRHGGATLPEIIIVDITKTPPSKGNFITPPLVEAINACLDSGEQSLLFLNRRGYAPLTLCRACGHRFQCRHCSAWMVEHRYHHGQNEGKSDGKMSEKLGGKLVCHQCGETQRLPTACPSCHREESLIACGPGVERLAEEVAKLFPTARVAIMDSDHLDAAAAQQLVTQIERRAVDIIIGTQMTAKGHHFPYLTLVGVIDADMGLQGGDLRAGERSWQLLHQVAGRAGRAESAGRVFLQTTAPNHPVITTLANYNQEAFLDYEMEERRQFQMPPFGRLAAIIVSSEDAKAAYRLAVELGRTAPRVAGTLTLGPAPAPFAQIRGRYRYRLLLKTSRTQLPQTLISDWLRRVKPPTTVRITIDIDPQSFT